jgi:myo-inositol-1-phosphate synthase
VLILDRGGLLRVASINVAIIGVGNCASALVQGVAKYKNVTNGQSVPGLMHPVLGEYGIGDINFVSAVDIDANKVGLDLSEAIFAEPNNAAKFHDVPNLGVTVQRGMVHDGVGKFMADVIKKAPGPTDDITDTLIAREVDVVVNYLPVGSEEATRWYVEQVLAAKCGFINCMPVFIASGEGDYWQHRFKAAGAPIIGDDIKSQVGATIVHRALTRLFTDRGLKLNQMYQLNFGGNSDFKNMLEQERLASKKTSKTNSVTSQIPYDIGPGNIHVGPSDYVPWLKDRKWCYIRMEAESFGGMPINLELKLEVEDSPNSAGVVIDAIRCCKIAKDRGLGGVVVGPSAYFMKSPPVQYADDVARQMVEDFIVGRDGDEPSE